MTNWSNWYKIKEVKEKIYKTEIEINLLQRQLEAIQKELEINVKERDGMTKAVKCWEEEMKENQLTTK